MNAPYYNGAPGEHVGDRDGEVPQGIEVRCIQCGGRAWLARDEPYQSVLCKRCDDEEYAKREAYRIHEAGRAAARWRGHAENV